MSLCRFHFLSASLFLFLPHFLFPTFFSLSADSMMMMIRVLSKFFQTRESLCQVRTKVALYAYMVSGERKINKRRDIFSAVCERQHLRISGSMVQSEQKRTMKKRRRRRRCHLGVIEWTCLPSAPSTFSSLHPPFLHPPPPHWPCDPCTSPPYLSDASALTRQSDDEILRSGRGAVHCC